MEMAIKTIIITQDPQIAADAQAVGVSYIMVDLESIGKKKRQAQRDTFISTHQLKDVKKIRDITTTSQLIVRINPFYAGSAEEIEHVIAAGAQIIMLPMIAAMDDVDEAVKLIAGRAKFLPLVETSYSMAHIADIAARPAVDDIYIGLNDLHLSLGLDFLFEPLALGLVEWMAAQITKSGKHFGFGGIATMGSGELPAEYILGEHVRIGSSCVILSSRFCKDIDIANPQGRQERIRHALLEMQHKIKEFAARTPDEIQSDSARTAAIIRKLAQAARNGRKKSVS
jgi:hypothetical protein